MSVHAPQEKPTKSGWYIATPYVAYTKLLHDYARAYPYLLLEGRRMYYSKPLHIWISFRQHFYWCSFWEDQA
jgi:hypothetical protein